MILIRIFAICFFIISMFAIKICHKVFNPLTVFCGIWTVIFSFSSLGLYDLKVATISTYLIMAMGIIFFSLGFLVNYYSRKKIKIKFGNACMSENYEFIPRYGLIYAILAFTLIFEVMKIRSSISILLNGGTLETVLFAVRNSSANDRGTVGNVLNNLIIGPFKFAIFPLCAYNIANKKKPLITIGTLMLMAMGVISSGGRVFIIYLMVALCVCFTFSGEGILRLSKTIGTRKKQKRRFKLLIAGFILLFIVVSLSRSGQKIISHMYLYFSMQPIMFQTWAEIIKEKGLYGYGEASLNGCTFHILYLIKNILHTQYPSHWYEVFNSIIAVDTDWKNITNSGLPANAYVSAFWYFYTDARVIGVVVFSFLFGFISSLAFKTAIRRPNIKNVCIYAMILFAVVDSYVRIRFATGDYVGGLLILCFIFFKKENNKFVDTK